MYIKLDYFYFSTFDLKAKVIEIWMGILPFPGEKHGQGEKLTKLFGLMLQKNSLQAMCLRPQD